MVNQVNASVTSSSEVMPGVYLMWLESAHIASTAKPGQFVMVGCGEETLLRRPLSIHRLDKAKLALFFSVVGKGTNWLAQRRTGDTVDLLGPMGNGFSIYPDSNNLLLVAGGVGIAPLCFLTQKALNQGCSVTLLLGAATTAQLYPRDLLPCEADLVTATEDGTAGRKGMITDLLPDFANGAGQIFACGPSSMYRTISTLSQQFPELKSAQISLEMRMGCGLGICYGCTLRAKGGLKQVCKNGPVFELNDIFWDDPAYNS